MSNNAEPKLSKSTISDPNLKLFVNDEYRYKAYRWYCLKTILLKLGVILAGTVTAIEGIAQIVGTLLG